MDEQSLNFFFELIIVIFQLLKFHLKAFVVLLQVKDLLTLFE
jgi:hypothetical protein